MPKRYSSRELIKLIKADGWEHVQTVGSHHQFRHPVNKGRVTITHPKKELPPGTANSILRQAGLK
ncbi:MAG: type II toxin-antitoxin system HicA family toxin [Alphaproteobacteria bacterium]|nr:type II toxin-antitoxin system HicA family toxin [Alphaproteobacteria bacterium]